MATDAPRLRRRPAAGNAGAAGRGRRSDAAGIRRGDLSWLRPLALFTILAVFGAATVARTAYWQIVKHSELAERAMSQYEESVVLPATRGRIFDRDGRPLVINTTVYSVAVNPHVTRQLDPAARIHLAQVLASVTGKSVAEVDRILIEDRLFAYVARRLPADRVQPLRASPQAGVELREEEVQSFQPSAPGSSSTLAASVLGYVDFDGVGQYGIEGFYNDRLTGRAGREVYYRDKTGHAILSGPGTRVDPVRGADIRLTLDAQIQYVAEQELARGVTAARAESGSVVVMDSRTGGIVALADYPSFNANDYGHANPATFKSAAASYLYEPGSVMKTVTLAGAIDSGAITPDTKINDPGWISVGGAVIRDWDNRPHGTVTMTNVLEKSLNVGAIRAMQMEGKAAFMRHLRDFGLLETTGVDLPYEAMMPPRPADRWGEQETATATFGQGLSVNMIQMTAAVNAIVNGGVYVHPHLVQDVDGTPVNYVGGQPRQVISPAAARLTTQMMKSVVQNGSGYLARVPGFEKNQTGKTGTSQIPGPRGYSENEFWASYVGSLPADNPRFTMLVVVRKPHNPTNDQNEGYYVSAPIWREIAKAIVLQWRIDPGGAG